MKKSKPIIFGAGLFGLIQPLPATGFPEGKLRWIIRKDSFVVARITTKQGTLREFYVKEEAGEWRPWHEKLVYPPYQAGGTPHL
jgi:hypothetical protein